jgi:hypothetical protein
LEKPYEPCPVDLGIPCHCVVCCRGRFFYEANGENTRPLEQGLQAIKSNAVALLQGGGLPDTAPAYHNLALAIKRGEG